MMKKFLLFILIGISIIISSCNGKRIHISETSLELDNNGFPKNEKVFFNGDSFSGIVFDEITENQVLFEINYKDGLPDGSFKSYYEDGQLKIMGNYNQGKEDGPFEKYHDNGKLKYKGNYKQGQKDGLFESYYDNGQLKLSGGYKFGERDGLYKGYFENGK